jgi:translation initiation factor IF-2
MSGLREKRELRPPVVAIVGHIDHGKSTLLDYIRATRVTEGEAGGITQHLSAYEATHTNATGEHKITFLDTPGHEAFRAMRIRGLEVADVAVLVVSAEDGVKPQTMEALKLIEEAKIPFIVAITKIDKPGVYADKAKNSLLEHHIYLEGLGGQVPWVGVSGKTGEGIPELLDLILLAAELEGLVSDESGMAAGVVIEGHTESRRGNTATLIVQKGILKSGEFIVSGTSLAPVRIMENFLGKPIKEAYPGSPVRIVGFSSLPQVGATWHATETKKEAEIEIEKARVSISRARALEGASPSLTLASQNTDATPEGEEEVEILVLPIVIKTDVAGMAEAVMHELEKIHTGALMQVKVVAQSTGTINQDDVRLVGSGKTPGLIVGFNVKVDKQAQDLAERQGVSVGLFEVIYKLTEWLSQEIEARRPKERAEHVIAAAKILKVFSASKKGTVVGGRVEVGTITQGAKIRIMRNELEAGVGEIVSLQSGKVTAKKVEKNNEFGALVETDIELKAGDMIEEFDVTFS